MERVNFGGVMWVRMKWRCCSRVEERRRTEEGGGRNVANVEGRRGEEGIAA